MEHWFQDRLQVAPGDFLCDSIGDSRNAQRLRTAIRFRKIDPPHRRRKVLPEDSRFQSMYRLFRRSASSSAIDCRSTPAAPWSAFTRLKASQTSRSGILNGFAPPAGSFCFQLACDLG